MQNNNIALYSGIFLGVLISAFILVPTAFGDTFFLIQKDGSTPIQSCTESNGFVLAQNITDLCDVVIITPMNNDVLQYNGTFWVNAVGVSDNTICANVGTGAQVFKDGECNFRTIVGSSDISIVQNLNEIVIDFNGTDSTACINVGTGTGYSCVEGTNVNLRSLLAGSGISITNSSNTITITNSSPDNTTCINVGSGAQVFKDDECNFRTILGSSDISVTQQDNTITIDFNGTLSGDTTVCGNVGSGANIHVLLSNCDARSLTEGNLINITQNTNDINIEAFSVGQKQSQMFSPLAKTNIGTVYVDIYSAVGQEEELLRINCDNVTEFAGFLQWQVGLTPDTQSARLVDTNDNNNVLFEKTDITADYTGRWATTDWISKPSWCISGFFEMEIQGKSTDGTDDPTVRGYIVYAR